MFITASVEFEGTSEVESNEVRMPRRCVNAKMEQSNQARTGVRLGAEVVVEHRLLNGQKLSVQLHCGVTCRVIDPLSQHVSGTRHEHRHANIQSILP
jgi:hypothetical protein